MNERIINAIDESKLDAYSFSIFKAMCAIKEVSELEELASNENAQKRLKTMYNYLSELM